MSSGWLSVVVCAGCLAESCQVRVVHSFSIGEEVLLEIQRAQMELARATSSSCFALDDIPGPRLSLSYHVYKKPKHV